MKDLFLGYAYACTYVLVTLRNVSLQSHSGIWASLIELKEDVDEGWRVRDK